MVVWPPNRSLGYFCNLFPPQMRAKTHQSSHQSDACSNFPVSSHWPQNGPYPVALIMYSPSSRRSSLLLNSWLCTVAYVPQNTQTRLWQLASCYGSRQQATLRMHLVLAILLSVGTNWLPIYTRILQDSCHFTTVVRPKGH